MRLLHIITLLSVLVTAVFAWEKEDHEIFDLVSALEEAEGKGTTFYSWLDVPSTASTSQIAKAYRKKSLVLHPDKNKGLKNAHERFARLGVIAKILRERESRERYDFFYKNGVPRWRGTGYYYSRFRPGVGTVVVFLVTVTSGVQYLVQNMNYNRDKKRVQTIIDQARSLAWGAKLVPIEGKRKVRVPLGAPRMDEDGNMIYGRAIDMVVEGSQVYILESNGDLLPVDQDTAVPPSVKNTWFLSLVIGLVNRARGSRGEATENGDVQDQEPKDDNETDGDSVTGSDSPGSGAATPKEGANGKGGRLPTAMAGGRRRKAVKRR